MKRCFPAITAILLLGIPASTTAQTYVGSTPAHKIVRQFLQISLKDSIDFIRWRLEIRPGNFNAQVQYGISKPNTPGFIDEKRVSLVGSWQNKDKTFDLTSRGGSIVLLQINKNILHLVGNDKKLLPGNGGYSYALNCISPVNTEIFNVKQNTEAKGNTIVFEGRTPCRELVSSLNSKMGPDCYKLKWYIQLYTDTLTGKSLYFIKGGVGVGYKTTTIERGKWQIITKSDGRKFYRITPDDNSYSLDLLAGDGNILFFTDSVGQPLVGNENFSYTLNRREGPRMTRAEKKQ